MNLFRPDGQEFYVNLRSNITQWEVPASGASHPMQVGSKKMKLQVRAVLEIAPYQLHTEDTE